MASSPPMAGDAHCPSFTSQSVILGSPALVSRPSHSRQMLYLFRKREVGHFPREPSLRLKGEAERP
jgi:hypothetical protein